MSSAQHSGVVYLLTAPTGERYVGRTTNYAKRMREYRAGGHGKVAAAIALHGWENFTKRPLAVGVADSALVATETAFITLLRPELNLMTAGIGGRVRHAESTKRKQAAASRRENLSAETLKKRSASLRGENNPMFGKPGANRGKPMPDEQRKKIAATLRGHPVSPETREKLRAANRNPSPETREKSGAAHRDKPLSAEHCENIAASLRDKPKSPEHRANMKLAQRERRRVPAIHNRLRELRGLGWPRAA